MGINFYFVPLQHPRWRYGEKHEPKTWMTFMGKRLLTLCSWRLETSQLSDPVKSEATVDALWMCIHLAHGIPCRKVGCAVGLVYHIGVGFCVARSTGLGNAKASSRGTSDSQRPTLFSYMPDRISFMITLVWVAASICDSKHQCNQLPVIIEIVSTSYSHKPSVG